jgi:glyoxylase-like metal-dependent hydrolase (beta-lactamase superfamily II)
MLVLDEQALPTPQAMTFWQRAGLPDGDLARRATERPFNFCDVVAPLALGFTRIAEGDGLLAAGRRWRVRTGDGHAPEHATLWCEEAPLILGGDQLLPSISANIGVYPTEPEADPLAEWLDSARRFQPLATDDQLVLPGHKLPFTGLPLRLRQMIENHEGALARLLVHLEQGQSASDCFPALFRRQIGAAEQGLALVEAVAHLNHLHRRGLITRRLDGDGVWLWQAGHSDPGADTVSP